MPVLLYGQDAQATLCTGETPVPLNGQDAQATLCRGGTPVLRLMDRMPKLPIRLLLLGG